MKKYLQDYNAILDRELRKIRESGLLKADKETIFEYYQYCVSNELSVPRMARTVSILRFVFESIQKPKQPRRNQQTTSTTKQTTGGDQDENGKALVANFGQLN